MLERSLHIRSEAIQQIARIRIALPYRPASQADLQAIGETIARLRATGVLPDDEVMTELENFQSLLEILVPPIERP